MIKRYSNEKVDENWALKHKFQLWQEIELAVIKVRCEMGLFPADIWSKISLILKNCEINVEEIKRIEEITKHDLNAFIEERKSHLPEELRKYVHFMMTSYDTEEAPFSLMLLDSIKQVEGTCDDLILLLWDMAFKYRYTPMLGRTHGQEAKLQSFGLRILRWCRSLDYARYHLQSATAGIRFAKLSGAIGNYQGITPEEEKEVLKSIGLEPFVGASQIIPRIVHQPLANALVMIVGALTQIAEDVRIAARSGMPIMQEFFDKGQMGSSAMPHKKNTITCENQVGMWRMAKGFAEMLRDCTLTWEERAIEQSCVERVAWPDLFHVVMFTFQNMTKVLKKLQVFPDNMILEIYNSHGCYASEDAATLLKEYGLVDKEAYRIVQLAAAIVHEPCQVLKDYRLAKKNGENDHQYPEIEQVDFLGGCWKAEVYETISDVISGCALFPMEALGHSKETVDEWNNKLRNIFADSEKLERWQKIFSIAYQLRNEDFIFNKYK